MNAIHCLAYLVVKRALVFKPEVQADHAMKCMARLMSLLIGTAREDLKYGHYNDSGHQLGNKAILKTNFKLNLNRL